MTANDKGALQKELVVVTPWPPDPVWGADCKLCTHCGLRCLDDPKNVLRMELHKAKLEAAKPKLM